MRILRALRHGCFPALRLRRSFSKAALNKIEAAVAASEQQHSGELRLVIESALPLYELLRGTSPRERAIELFSRLRVWDTAGNSGVLLYLLLADRDIEIVADRGIDQQAGAAVWSKICKTMEAEFRQGRFTEGVIGGIAAISEILTQYCPPRGDDQDELPNQPLVL